MTTESEAAAMASVLATIFPGAKRAELLLNRQSLGEPEWSEFLVVFPAGTFPRSEAEVPIEAWRREDGGFEFRSAFREDGNDRTTFLAAQLLFQDIALRVVDEALRMAE